MAQAYNKFNAWVQNVQNGGVAMATDALKVMLSNTAPVATNSLYGDISGNELASGNGYTTGGASVTVTANTQTGGTYTLAANQVQWTASANMGPFRYSVIYDSTATSPLKPLIAWWDYGSAVNLIANETFTVQFNSLAANGTIYTLT